MNITILIVVSFLMMVFLASGIILFALFHQRKVLNHQLQLKILNEQKQNELLDASIKAEEDERLRISSELHDDVGATLATLKLILKKGIQSKNNDLLSSSELLLDHTFQKVRSISHKLQPGNLQQFGLQVAISSVVELYNKVDGIQIDFEPNYELPRLDYSIELGYYRILQELIHNLAKHANVKVLKIAQKLEEDMFSLVLMHNGKGINNAQFETFLLKSDGIGLKNILNRVNGMRGTINFTDGNPDFNYHIIVSVNFRPFNGSN